MRSEQRFVAGIFAALLLLPTLAILVTGPLKELGNQRLGPLKTSFDRLRAAPRKEVTRLASGFLNRSPMRLWALRWKNRFDADLMGYIDTEDVVSGVDGWLYYKPQFWGGRCVPEGEYLRALNRARVLSELMAAADRRLLIAIAPDKFAVHPEYRHPRAAWYHHCKQRSSDLWRRLAAERLPGLIDHRVPMMEPPYADDRKYWDAGTHWNQLGAALAFQQLLQRLGGGVELEPSDVGLANPEIRSPDMAGKMLLLNRTSTGPSVSADWIASLQRSIQGVGASPLVVHDSFYEMYPWIAEALPSGAMINISRFPGDLLSRIRDHSGPIVLSLVERSMLHRFNEGVFSPRARVYRGIREINSTFARRHCVFDRAIEIGEADSNGVSRTPGAGNYVALSAAPSFIIRVPDEYSGRVCLRISVTTGNATHARLYSSTAAAGAASGTFEDGSEIYWDVGEGNDTFTTVIERPSDGMLRLEPVAFSGEFSLRLELGQPPREGRIGGGGGLGRRRGDPLLPGG